MEEFRSNCFVLGQQPWVSNSVYLPLIQVPSGPQRTSDTANFTLETFRPSSLVYQEQSSGLHSSSKQRIPLQLWHRGGHCRPPPRWKAARTKEHAAREGPALPAEPSGTFSAQLTTQENLSSKPRDFKQELI